MDMDGLTAIQRLEGLLNERDNRIADLEEQLRSMEDELRGSRHGWWRGVKVEDDDVSPVPRLEFSYEPLTPGDWSSFVVVYRLVMRDFDGDLIAHPLGRTRRDGCSSREPPCGVSDLPRYDSVNAAHDAAHLAAGPDGNPLRCFMRVPGKPLLLLDMGGWGAHSYAGRLHRRETRYG